MKPVIICIIGASGSGKTTASLILQQQFGWKAIVSYTTRPMRPGERNGIDHWFVTQQDMPAPEQICAYTAFGGYEYWTEWVQFVSVVPCVYVIDEKGLVNLQSKEHTPFSFSLITIKLQRDDLTAIAASRQNRDVERIHIPDDLYDYIIDNNGSLEQLRVSLYLTAKCIIQNL